MGFSSSLCPPHIPASYGCSCQHFKLFSARRKTLTYVAINKRFGAPHGIYSVLGARRFSINSNEAPEPARALLERLFVQTQKLEEQMNGNSLLVENVQSSFDLENLESDLHAALEALRKKEEDLLEAEKRVKMENAVLNQAREEVERREKKIQAACSRQEKLEGELRQANLKVISQARHIEDLRLRLTQRDQETTMVKSEVSSKENEIDKINRILTRMNDEKNKANAELESKSQLLNQVNEVVKKQELELEVLRNSLLEKELKLEELMVREKNEEEKVKMAESKLEKQTMEWLVTQEELKKLGEIASKHVGESTETMENFRRVKSLLVDVRSELVSSRESLVTSRQTMEERELLFEKQLLELDEQKKEIMSYMNGLKSAHIDVEIERAKLRVVEAWNKELELDLSLKRGLIHGLQEQLDKEKVSLEKAILERCLVREELDKKNKEFEETSNFLEAKEKELVEARLEIQHLKLEQQSLLLVLKERDSELSTSRRRLEGVNREALELRILLNAKEQQLMLTTDMLKEKEVYAQEIEHELNHAKVKASEAASVVGRIVNLTQELVKDDDLDALLGKPTEDYRWQRKQFEAELELARENLRANETELLIAQRQLTVKDEELKMIHQRLEEKDGELKVLTEEETVMYAREGACENRVQELAFEKLRLEAAQLEVEAATTALHKLVEMSRDLLNKASLCIDTDLDVNVFLGNQAESESRMVETVFLGDIPESNLNVVRNGGEYFTEVKSEVARLSALTERLAQEAGAGV